MVGPDEGQLGRVGMMKLDRDFLFGSQLSGGGELRLVAVGRGNSCPSQREPDRGMAGTAVYGDRFWSNNNALR